MEQNTENSSLFELQIDHNATAYLKEAARWAKFLSIVGFVFCGLMIIIGIFAGSIFTFIFSRMNPEGFGGAGVGVFFTVIYILLAALNFFPCLYTYNFATKAQTALRNNDQEQLNLSLKNLKSLYRFLGILMIIVLGFYAIAIVFGLIGLAFVPRVG
jgi:hypothetical protein